MKINLFVITALLLLNFSSAFLGEFDPGECVNIRTVLNVSEVNISSINIPAPNGTVLYLNEPMTKNAQTFNYTFCQTETRGFYVYDYFDGEGNTYTNDFYIGKLITPGESMVYVILLVSNILFFIFFLVIAIKVPYGNIEDIKGRDRFIIEITKTKYIKVIAIWLSAGTFLWFFAILTGLTSNFISFVPLINLMQSAYNFLYITLGLGLSVFMSFYLMILIWKDILFSKQIRKFGKAFIKNVS